jgi:hypothetical protein
MWEKGIGIINLSYIKASLMFTCLLVLSMGTM